MSKGHWSDCALHNGPVGEPKPCNCGIEPGLTPEEYGGCEWPDKLDDGTYPQLPSRYDD